MTRIRWAAAAVSAAVLAVGLAAAWWTVRPPPPDQPNVLLITLDTTRWDHLGAYGYFRKTTPNLDRLARRSYTFTDAWAPMATTLPSHTSLLTGAWPLEHGVLANIEHGGRRTLPSDALVPISELFRRAGWQTAAFVSATPLAEGTGIERGFETFDSAHRKVRHAHRTTDAAIAWLRKNGRKPFFAWVHYYDPHNPFNPPDEHRVFSADTELLRFMEDRGIPDRAYRAGGAELDPLEAHDTYDGEIAFVDHELDRLLDLVARKEWGDRTVVVVVADHGEGLGQHGVGGHGQVWREQLQVPLVVHVPWEQGRRVDTPTSMVDVVPTLLRWVDLPGEEDWLGVVSGRDVLEGPSGPSLGITSLRQVHLLGTEAQRALTAASWRYVEVDGAGKLFELRSDPHERVDLAPVLPFHRAVLAGWTTEVEAAQRAKGLALGSGATVDVPLEEREALEQLGYVE